MRVFGLSSVGIAVRPGPWWSTSMPARMVLMRHGATEWSSNGQHTGRTDIPLLDEGCHQAKVAGELLRRLELASFGQVLTSPLRRAAETCALAGFEGQPEPDLMEWDYGAYEGLTSAEIRERRPGWTPLVRRGARGRASRRRRPPRRPGHRSERGTARGTRCAWPTGICCGSWQPGGSDCRPWPDASSCCARGGLRAGLGPGLAGHRDVEPGTGLRGPRHRNRDSAEGLPGPTRRCQAVRRSPPRSRGPGHHVGQAVGLQMGTDRLPDVGPDGQQDALALVVAGAVRVGLSEVAGGDGAVDGGHDLGQGDLLGRAGQHVSAADASLGADEAGALQGQEDLLEVGLGQAGPLGDVPDRGRCLGPVEGQREQRPAGVVTSRRDPHRDGCYRPHRRYRGCAGRRVSLRE